jgi:ferrous iron transport protein B
MLKKFKVFRGEPSPFVMELPSYHAPVSSNILRTTAERGWSFIKKAGTVILIATIIIWILNSLSFEGGLHYITEVRGGVSILEWCGSAVAWLFAPLGFNDATAAVATIMGLIAKVEVVAVFGVTNFTGLGRLAGVSFLVFNLLCAPCFAAMGAIRREMNSAKWTAFAISYQCVFAYGISLMIYQFGRLFCGAGNVLGAAFAFACLGLLLFLLFRPHSKASKNANK